MVDFHFERVANSLIQALECSDFQFGETLRKVSFRASLLVLEAVGHPAGIRRRLKTREVLMKALIFHETGEPKSVLKLQEIPTPPVAAGEALVRVLLSPINASDLHMVRGRYGYQPDLPASPGIEGVGIVEAVRSGRARCDGRNSCNLR